jgi:hypothetical protein
LVPREFLVLLFLLLWGAGLKSSLLSAQEISQEQLNNEAPPPTTTPATPQTVPPTTPVLPPGFKEMTSKNALAPCLEPQKLPGIDEYEGPMKKMVGMFGRAIERNSVYREPHFLAGATLCAFGPKEKFIQFLQGTIDPMVILSAAFEAGIDQSSNRDPSFGLGAEGYGKRLAASYTDWNSGRFFKGFFYPVIFNEDPRYYRLGQGSAGRRMAHAAGHTVIAHKPDATRVFNYSEWFGTATTVALSNFYHPGNSRGSGEMARSAAFLVGIDLGFDLLREFWPDIARKMKLPFRGLKTSDVQKRVTND